MGTSIFRNFGNDLSQGFEGIGRTAPRVITGELFRTTRPPREAAASAIVGEVMRPLRGGVRELVGQATNALGDALGISPEARTILPNGQRNPYYGRPSFADAGGEITGAMDGRRGGVVWVDGMAVRSGEPSRIQPRLTPHDITVMGWGERARAARVAEASVDAAGENFLKDVKEINDLMTSDQRTMLHAAITNIGADGQQKSPAQRVSEWEAIEKALNRDTAAHPEKADNNELISRKITALTVNHERFAFKDLGVVDSNGGFNRRAAALFAENARNTTGIAVSAGTLPRPAPTIAPLEPSAVVVSAVPAPGPVVSRPLDSDPIGAFAGAASGEAASAAPTSNTTGLDSLIANTADSARRATLEAARKQVAGLSSPAM